MEIRRAKDRGHSHFGWLDSWHTFSFGSYEDPQALGFSNLLVINDDTVQGGGGFAPHPHQDMEIFSYVLDGELEHKDSMGNGSTIRPGDVQLMTAGTGVRHSEYNHSPTKPVHFLQIWIEPDRKRAAPRYQQVNYGEAEKRGRLRLILSPTGESGSLSLYQQAKVYAGLLNGAEAFSFVVPPQRFAYVHVARGSLVVNGAPLEAGDGAKVRESGTMSFTGGRDAEVLVFELEPIELPTLRE
jgi:redox-sensitive bicupin YhaK (pirin superfamily)